MHFRLLIFSALFLSFSALGSGRAPAVEDFVGIEVDHVESTPKGAESLYNLENDIHAVQIKESEHHREKMTPSVTTREFTWEPLAVLTMAILVLVPMFACLVTMRKLRKKATIESASNIEVLEKYRKEREARKNQETKKVA